MSWNSRLDGLHDFVSFFFSFGKVEFKGDDSFLNSKLAKLKIEFVLQEAKRLLNEKKDEADYKLVIVGDKAKASMQQLFSKHVLFSCNDIGRTPPTFEDASTIAAKILASDFKFDRVISIIFPQIILKIEREKFRGNRTILLFKLWVILLVKLSW